MNVSRLAQPTSLLAVAPASGARQHSLSKHEERWQKHLHTLVHVNEIVLSTKRGEHEGKSFVLTPEEMRSLLELLSQKSTIVSHDKVFVRERMVRLLDSLLMSFISRRAV